MSMFHEEPVSS